MSNQLLFSVYWFCHWHWWSTSTITDRRRVSAVIYGLKPWICFSSHVSHWKELELKPEVINKVLSHGIVFTLCVIILNCKASTERQLAAVQKNYYMCKFCVLVKHRSLTGGPRSGSGPKSRPTRTRTYSQNIRLWSKTWRGASISTGAAFVFTVVVAESHRPIACELSHPTWYHSANQVW